MASIFLQCYSASLISPPKNSQVMSSRNPVFVSRTGSCSSSPTSQETETHQTPSKQQENPVQVIPNQENPQFLLSDSTKAEIVDAIFLLSLLSYKLSVGPLPSFDDDSLSTQGQQLLDYVNADPDNRECFSDTLLREEVLKLHSKYEKLVEERLEKPDEEDLSTDSEKLVFLLSERIWGPEYDNYVFPEVNVDQEVAVSGNSECSKDQDQEPFLFPSSTSEKDDDIATLVNLNIYKVDDESSVASVLDQHSLADFINSNRKNRGFVNEARLRDTVFKLQTRYKKFVEENGKNPSDDDFSTYKDYLIFHLSKKVWGKEPEANV